MPLETSFLQKTFFSLVGSVAWAEEVTTVSNATIRGLKDCETRGYKKTGFFEVDTGEELDWTISLSGAKTRFARAVKIAVQGPQENLCNALESTFAPYQDGSATVFVEYRNQRARASLELGREFTVKPCEELVAALNELDSISGARLIY